MFKSLLNTLPIISGNFTIACKLNDITKHSKEKFYVYISNAEIKSNDVSSSIYKALNINLANSKYAFDVKRYGDTCNIYKDNYTYNKDIFRVLDTNYVINDRNKTFEFGCQRIAHKLYGYEWSFYAPIYINNINDLPDYFVINVKNKTNGRILKQIKVAIGKRYNYNKLYYYIKRHVETIENNIPITWHYNNNEIVLNNAIDYSTGTITTKIVQSASQILYKDHVTINEFDSMLSYLYYNTNSIMSEIMPLSFEFNLDDFLTSSEKYYYEFNDFDIIGYYEKNGIPCEFYIFDTNSHSSAVKYKFFDIDTNKFIIKQKDVYNINSANSLHEGTNIYLKDTNTLNKTYCKWCNYDNNEYQVNNNVSYSLLLSWFQENSDTQELDINNQTFVNKYGEYPMFKSNTQEIALNINTFDGQINAIVPVYDKYSKASEDGYSASEIEIYKYLINNNISTWFDIYSEDNFNNINNWTEVNKHDNSCFCHGVLYHNLPNDIDYFNLFVNLKYTDASIMQKSNISYDGKAITIDNYTNIYDLYNNNRSNVSTNEYLKKIYENEELIDDEQLDETNTYYVFHDNITNEKYIDDTINNVSISEKYNSILTKLKDCYLYIDTYTIKTLVDIVSSKDDNGNIYVKQEIIDNCDNIYYYNEINNTYTQLKLFISDTTIQKTSINNQYITNKYLNVFKKTEFVYIPTELQIFNRIDKLCRDNDLCNLETDEHVSFIENVVKIIYRNIDAILNGQPIDYTDSIIYNQMISNIEDYDGNLIIAINSINILFDYYADMHSEAVLKLSQLKQYLLLFREMYLPVNNKKINSLTTYYYTVDNDLSINYVNTYFIKYSNAYTYNIYVDSYQLKQLIDKFKYVYNKNTGKYIERQQANISYTEEEKFNKILDDEFLKEYFNGLYHDLTNEDKTESEILDTLYVKVKYVDTTNVNGFITKYYVYKLLDYLRIYCGIEDDITADQLLDNITYNGSLFKFDYSSFNSTSTEQEKITYIELYFNKKVVKIGQTLYNILDTRYYCEIIDGKIVPVTKYSAAKYCYYYTTMPSDSSIYMFVDDRPTSPAVQKAVNKFTYPLFESTYLTDITQNDFLGNNELLLKRIEQNNYRYNSIDNIISVFEKIPYETAEEYVKNKRDITIYKYSHINYSEIEENDDNIIQTKKTTDKNGNEITLGYIMVNNYISINTMSYNIKNNIYDNVNIETINEVPLKFNKTSKKYEFTENQFKIIYPFMKNDIFLDVLYLLRNWIILPTSIKLLIKYKSVYINDLNSTQLVKNPLQQYIFLNRYFGNIMPLFTEVKSAIPDMYKEIYKIDGLNFVNNQYVSYKKFQCNMYNNEPVYYITKLDDLQNFDEEHSEYMMPENKHFNNNILYHLPTTMSIEVDDKVRYEDIEQYETEEKIFEYFSNYVKKHYFNSIDKQSLLFLFNKYLYICEKNVVQYNLLSKVRLYSIIYNFSLK